MLDCLVMSLYRRRCFAALFLCWLLLSQANSMPVGAQDPAAEIFQLVNGFRAELGLPPFTYNPTLAIAAQQQAAFIAANNVYTHTGAGGTSPQDRANALGYNGYVVENIVGGTNLSPRQGLIWWQNSPVHYNTLVSTRHTEAGIGYAFGNGQHRFALVVGRPANVSVASSRTGPDESPAPIIIEPIELAAPQDDGSIVHVVGTGQALWTIAAYYEVPIADLLLFNNLREDEFVQPGDALFVRLADGQAPPATPTPPPFHTVREGQTLWTIAAIYQLKLSDLLWINNLAEDAYIQPGDELLVRIPADLPPRPTATPQTTHIVQAGDTPLGIAARYGISLDSLYAYNQLTADALLQVGAILYVVDPIRLTPTATPMPTIDPSPSPAVIDREPILQADAIVLGTQITATPIATLSPTFAANDVSGPDSPLTVANLSDATELDSHRENPTEDPSPPFLYVYIIVAILILGAVWVFYRR